MIPNRQNMKMKMKKILTVLSLIVILSLFALPVFAVSSDFLEKANKFYQRNCTKDLNVIPRPTAILCYLYDKVHEQDEEIEKIKEEQRAHSEHIDDLQVSTSANLEEINALKKHRILAYGQYRGAGFTTNSNTDVPTDAKVEINCPVTCAITINYSVDTRNSQTGAHNIYTIYLDGVNQSFVNQASFAFPGQANPLALTGIVSAQAGTHTVEIYARTTAGGTLEEHTKTLTVLAIAE